MNDDRYVEYGAATGILFVILTVIGFAVVIPNPPDLNAPSQEWASYFLGHHNAIRAGDRDPRGRVLLLHLVPGDADQRAADRQRDATASVGRADRRRARWRAAAGRALRRSGGRLSASGRGPVDHARVERPVPDGRRRRDPGLHGLLRGDRDRAAAKRRIPGLARLADRRRGDRAAAHLRGPVHQAWGLRRRRRPRSVHPIDRDDGDLPRPQRADHGVGAGRRQAQPISP